MIFCLFPSFFPGLLMTSIVPLGSASAQDYPQPKPDADQAGENISGPSSGAAGNPPGRPKADGLFVTLGVAPVLSPAFQGWLPQLGWGADCLSNIINTASQALRSNAD